VFVFITAVPITKLFAWGGGEQWRTGAPLMRGKLWRAGANGNKIYDAPLAAPGGGR
jgi:hypothetical protein